MSPGDESPGRKGTGLLAGLLVLLVAYSLYLSLTRIYQVDEAQNVFMARITALGAERQYYSNGSLFLLGPMAWIAGAAERSAAMFIGCRLLFFTVYWLNLALLPLAAGLRLRSRAYMLALVGAATLAPLLDYGLEIRHDNVLLTLMLLAWLVVRRFRGQPAVGFLVLGLLSGLMQFTAFKAVLYWLPMSAAVLISPPARLQTPGIRRLTCWVAGLAVAALAAFAAYSAGTGTAWEAYVLGLGTAFGHSADALRFTPWETLGRLLRQTPLLLAVGAAVAARAVRQRSRANWRALGWESSGPEALLFLLATLALFANPVPYPYNLLHWVPFLALWVLRAQRDPGVEGVPPAILVHPARPLLAGTLLFCLLVPSAQAALRHLSWTNARQLLLMNTAEALTDPERDRVYDAAGLVPSRASVGYQWFLHSLVLEGLRSGRMEPLGRQLAANPPEVVLRSYRTDWLGPSEQEFVKANYIALADDIYVLGTELPAGGGSFVTLHAGRYYLRPWSPAGASGLSAGIQVDGVLVAAGSVVDLSEGLHDLRTEGDAGVQVIWVGPRLMAPPRLPNRSHRELFVNWY